MGRPRPPAPLPAPKQFVPRVQQKAQEAVKPEKKEFEICLFGPTM